MTSQTLLGLSSHVYYDHDSKGIYKVLMLKMSWNKIEMVILSSQKKIEVNMNFILTYVASTKDGRCFFWNIFHPMAFYYLSSNFPYFVLFHVCICKLALQNPFSCHVMTMLHLSFVM